MTSRFGGFRPGELKMELNQKNNPDLIPSGLSSPLKHVPNTLTILRLLGTPFVLWGIAESHLTLAFWSYFAICLTDWLDGFLARQWKVTSKLGQVLDPIADKSLLISVYLFLGLWAFIPLWLTALVLARDVLILIIGGLLILGSKGHVHLPALLIGKISTTLQMLFIGIILGWYGPISTISTSSIQEILMVSFLYIVALTTILSGFTYARVALQATLGNQK